MTNVAALKTLYVAFGGSADDVASLTETSAIIAKLATLAGNIGIELPKVTASDNGKVLTVVSGKWAAADLPA